MKTKIKKLRKKPIKLACERNGIKMKFIEKLTLIIYSNIILILSIIACLLIFGWLDINVVQNLVKNLLLYGTSSRIILGVSIVFILLSIRCIFHLTNIKTRNER